MSSFSATVCICSLKHGVEEECDGPGWGKVEHSPAPERALHSICSGTALALPGVTVSLPPHRWLRNQAGLTQGAALQLQPPHPHPVHNTRMTVFTCSWKVQRCSSGKTLLWPWVEHSATWTSPLHPRCSERPMLFLRRWSHYSRCG